MTEIVITLVSDGLAAEAAAVRAEDAKAPALVAAQRAEDAEAAAAQSAVGLAAAVDAAAASAGAAGASAGAAATSAAQASTSAGQAADSAVAADASADAAAASAGQASTAAGQAAGSAAAAAASAGQASTSAGAAAVSATAAGASATAAATSAGQAATSAGQAAGSATAAAGSATAAAASATDAESSAAALASALTTVDAVDAALLLTPPGAAVPTGFTSTGATIFGLPLIANTAAAVDGAAIQAAIQSALEGIRADFGSYYGLSPSLWSPEDLFGPTDTGWVFDASDLSTLFQDSTGTLAAAVGQPVGLSQDLSGKSNHRRQSTSLNRTTLIEDGAGRKCLSFDGVNDSLATAAFAWGTDELTVVTAVRKLREATQILIETGSGAVSVGAFYLVTEPTSSRYGFAPRGNRAANANDQTSITGFAAPDTAVLSAQVDLGAGEPARLRRNGGAFSYSVSTDFGSGNFGTWAAYFGARTGSTLFSQHYEYCSFAINRVLTPEELVKVEMWAAAKAGVVL